MKSIIASSNGFLYCYLSPIQLNVKKNFYYCFFILVVIQSQSILWEKSYGGLHTDYLFDAQPTADYGFVLQGSSLPYKTGNKTEVNHGDLDYWVWKMNEKGDLE